MQPLFFGKASRQLFGVYHPPQTRRPGEAAVVLCYPIVQEYMRTHWVMRKLALALAREGLPALRFDYLGTGDSAGGAESFSVAQWCADIETAAAELLDLSGARKVSLVGLRLGAALAALVTSGRLSVKDLVLWEPPAGGVAHLAELEAIEAVKRGNFRAPPQKGPEELLAYAMPDSLREELGRVDLSKEVACKADRVFLIASDPRPEHDLLCAGVRDRSGKPPQVQIVHEDARDKQGGVVLSSKVLQAITTTLATRGAA